MQPTTLCNVDWVYCYLPARNRNPDMTPEVARAVASASRIRDSSCSRLCVDGR